MRQFQFGANINAAVSKKKKVFKLVLKMKEQEAER